jgi:hypothetical protein
MRASGQLHVPGALPPGKEPLVPRHENMWALESVWKRWRRKRKSLPCPCRESKPCRPTLSLVTMPTELPRLKVNKLWMYLTFVRTTWSHLNGINVVFHGMQKCLIVCFEMHDCYELEKTWKWPRPVLRDIYIILLEEPNKITENSFKMSEFSTEIWNYE